MFTHKPFLTLNYTKHRESSLYVNFEANHFTILAAETFNNFVQIKAWSKARVEVNYGGRPFKWQQCYANVKLKPGSWMSHELNVRPLVVSESGEVGRISSRAFPSWGLTIRGCPLKSRCQSVYPGLICFRKKAGKLLCANNVIS